MDETSVLLLQIDGFGMNAATLAVVTAVVGAMAGAITWLWKYANSRTDRYIDRLERENDRLEREKAQLNEALTDALRTGHKAVDTADDAARELLKRRAKRQP